MCTNKMLCGFVPISRTTINVSDKIIKELNNIKILLELYSMYTILTYGFPLILVVFEWGLKFILAVENTAFTGPALATAGLSYLIPLSKPKVLPIPIQGQAGAFATTERDSQLIGFNWLLILAALFSWSASCYFSIKAPTLKIFDTFYLHFLIGLCTYVVSLLMTLLKEKL